MPAPGRSGSPRTCSGFLPSRDGFAFANDWPPAPAITLPMPVRSIGIGNAAAGLCGGMVFAALDYWRAGLRPPQARPVPGSPLYRYLVRRLIASWNIPGGVARYYGWMNLPDGDSHLDLLGRRLLPERGVSSRTITTHWPRLRASLDRGTPAALGLVTVVSTNPGRLRHNHQALAFGYMTSGTEVIVRVYDPNTGPDDGVGIRFDTSSPGRATEFRHNLRLDRPVRGFFLNPYSPAVPPPTERT
jgi:hypothetical protein